MKKFLILVLILVLNIGCSPNKSEIPESSKISVKYRVLDEKISPNNRNCSDKSVPYLKLENNDCSFSIGNYEFDIEKKYLIDNNGNLKEFWTYLSEGPLTYSVDELNQDMKFKKHENLEKFNVRISKNRTEIIDAKDTLKIEQIFKNEKLILIERKENNGRRILFAYN
ncbi:hypothetical protein [uncultured Winogradskyella sp.]|uniref:hypothetical protein n=1 Tax=uncultured Winogradskyella sp. TaxID=395353 RepID=UPI00261E7B5F|nr:hypothetical protein [uncultured Winogradskyella sp.]